ncbi:MAG: glycine betaine/L-proline ABC transporter ATP-binding protein [Bacteroidales bacterium]|jgi:glycine betaine/proline transport system ATP-binding protein|nr:glycine betaine/L-proline ABC transporter ATP-binding protein [Bacteroidales bacterium]
MEEQIKVENISVIFGKHQKDAINLLNEGLSKDEILKKTNCTVAVNNVNFSINKGEIFVVMGLSGSGKSTLIRTFNRLLEPTSGKIFLNGKDVISLDKDELRNIRRKEYGMIFQNFGLLPHRTVSSNASFGLEIQGVDKETRKKKAYEVLKTVGLEGYEEKMTGELSGGMQQRVGLARGLVNNPEILLMDEAFSALDPLIRANMQDELIDIQNTVKKTIIFITHDLDEALKLGDRIAIMKDGSIVQIGTPEEILSNPADDYVKAFVENVDKSTIITASSIMFKNPTFVDSAKDGPEYIIRKMKNIGLSILPVINEKKQFIGFINDIDVIKLKNKEVNSIKELDFTKSSSVKPDTPVNEIIPIFKDSNIPIAVVDDEKKLKGIVMHASVVAQVIGKGKEEIEKIIEKGYDI